MTMQQAFQEFMKNVHTCAPGIVLEYDARRMRANIQPSHQLVMKDGTRREQPELLDVPVVWSSNGRFVCHMKLVRGDSVWLLYGERGINQWKEMLERGSGGMTVEPDPAPTHGIGNAVAWPVPSMPVTPLEPDAELSCQSIDGTVGMALGSGVRLQAGSKYVTLDSRGFRGSDVYNVD